MGGSLSSSISEHVDREFERLVVARTASSTDPAIVRPHDSDPSITLADILQFKQLDTYPVDTAHLGTLYILDRTKTGRVKPADLTEFAQLCATASMLGQPFEFKNTIRAHCSYLLWQDMCEPRKRKEFPKWFTRLVSAGYTLQFFEEHPGTSFISSDAVESAYEVLHFRDAFGLDFQTVVSHIQQIGEENGYMELDNEEFDDVVPLLTMEKIAKHFIDGFMNMMSDVGFSKDVHKMPTK